MRDHERTAIFINLYRLSKQQIFIDQNASFTQERDSYELLETENKIEIDYLEQEFLTYFKGPSSSKMLARS